MYKIVVLIVSLFLITSCGEENLTLTINAPEDGTVYEQGETIVISFTVTDDIDITTIALTMDSWYVSEPLKQELHQLGFKKIVVAGKSSYVFSHENFKGSASDWKKKVNYDDNLWGIDVPAKRKTHNIQEKQQ